MLLQPLSKTLFVSALCAASAGCVDVDGGAVELSWALRSFSGENIATCAEGGIEEVQICWDLLGDGSAPQELVCPPRDAGSSGAMVPGARVFDCSDKRGVSGFEVPAGNVLFWPRPLCADGQPPADGTYLVPPPVARTVESGQVVTLNALLIVLAPTTEDGRDLGNAKCREP